MSTFQQPVLLPNPRPAAHGCNVVELEDGRLAVCWFAGTREGVEDQRVLISTSDNAVDWSEPEILVDHFQHEGDRWMPEIAALIRAPESGALWVVFSAAPISSFSYRKERNAFLRDLNQARLFQAQVRMDPWAMEQPVEIPSRRPLILQGKALSLAPDRWLLQCNARDSKGQKAAALLEGSPSLGWTETRHICVDPGCLEPSTAVFSDGAVLTYLRYSGVGGHIWRCESKSGTSGLSEPVQTTLRNPNSGIDIAAADDDDALLIVYNDNYRLRTPLSLGLSHDRGMTFRCRDIEIDYGEFSYPKLFKHSSGQWYAFYTHMRDEIACFAFDIEHLAEGRPVFGLRPTENS